MKDEPGAAAGTRLQPERFADGLDHPEGLAFTSDGDLWTGGEAGQIYRIRRDGSWSVEAETEGSCLGLAVDREDAIYICDPRRQAVLRYRAGGSVHVFADRVADRLLENPNFPVFDASGNLYVSCSGTWGRADGWIARYRADGRSDVMATGLDLANGLAVDATDEHLYVAETRADCVSRIPLSGPAEPELVLDGIDHLPDGLAFDDRGGLLIACYASDTIYRMASTGEVEVVAEDRDSIELAHPTNLAFGGAGLSELYVACHALRHIARLHPTIAGHELYGGPRATVSP